MKVNFPFTKEEGKRRKLSFPSTVDNFRPTFRSPRYSFIASYDAKNELERIPERGHACLTPRFREKKRCWKAIVSKKILTAD